MRKSACVVEAAVQDTHDDAVPFVRLRQPAGAVLTLFVLLRIRLESSTAGVRFEISIARTLERGDGLDARDRQARDDDVVDLRHHAPALCAHDRVGIRAGDADEGEHVGLIAAR